MSNAETAPDAARSPRLVALLAAAGLIVVTVVIVLVFGVTHPAALDAVDANNGPSTAVAWTQWDTDNTWCVHIAETDGTVRQPWCERDWIDLVGWTDEGLIVHRWANTALELVIDPDSGEIIERREAGVDDRRFAGDALYSRHVDGLLTVEDIATGELLWQVEISSVYNVWGGTVSPDERWIVAGDNADRLVVFDRQGGPPLVWATGVEIGGYVLWQGDDLRGETDTVDDGSGGDTAS